MNRIKKLENNLGKRKRVLGEIGIKHKDDVVIVCAIRTPITKRKKGGLNNTPPEIILSHILKNIIKKSKIEYLFFFQI